ncbi:MAG: hypothetical protein EOM40_13960 [Clostridia bacterium]|nr:hypothetical protein [Clostridia bacterium]
MRKGTHSIAKFIIGIFTVILTLLLIILVVSAVNEIKDFGYYSDYYTEENYISYTHHEDYYELLGMTIRDCRFGKKYSDEEKECRAVAYYYQAASLYKAYMQSDDKKNAGIQVQRMEQYATQTGEYTDHVAKINEILGINETEG